MAMQCYSWPLVVKSLSHNQVALVLKECGLLSVLVVPCECTGISPVSLLWMVLEECSILCVCTGTS